MCSLNAEGEYKNHCDMCIDLDCRHNKTFDRRGK